jgi:hypothetical protein
MIQQTGADSPRHNHVLIVLNEDGMPESIHHVPATVLHLGTGAEEQVPNLSDCQTRLNGQWFSTGTGNPLQLVARQTENGIWVLPQSNPDMTVYVFQITQRDISDALSPSPLAAVLEMGTVRLLGNLSVSTATSESDGMDSIPAKIRFWVLIVAAVAGAFLLLVPLLAAMWNMGRFSFVHNAAYFLVELALLLCAVVAHLNHSNGVFGLFTAVYGVLISWLLGV